MDIMSKWRVNPDTLEDGYYWYRVNTEYPKDSYEVLQVCNGFIIDVQPVDSFGAVWEMYEHNNFTGQWYGPILPPG